MNLPLSKNKVSPDEYLALERDAVYKSEYFNSEIFAMVGASRKHNQININISTELNMAFKEKSCVVYSNDMRVKIEESGDYVYPDIVALCGESLFDDRATEILLNPSVIIEVLSQSTEAYDRGLKFQRYRLIPSLEEYILVSQDQVWVERYVRHGTGWIFSEYKSLDDGIKLEPVGCTLYLKDIYHKVEINQ
ncbi:MAG: Uma2 family endonuclease [Planctomycetes bacterium]|nr:Uma2 family endonuclease [Planctomycetota bacterium]